ncbi:MAG: S1 RNA-binding domain-containing protein [Clostridia bacterium]|nr:S1 RNA-binding domain-containing protein [Clostridia bacterium]
MSEDNKSFEELLNDSINNTRKKEKIVKGKVISISSNGEIFVDIDYKADGIIPRTEYSFNLEAKPENEFKPGDTITCEVLRWNDGEGNVLLSYKRLKQKLNREELEKRIENNEIFEEKVSETNSNGLIVNYKGTRIFIPNSLSAHQTENVKFKIIEYKPKERKIIGSCKAVIDEEKSKIEKEFWDNAEEGKEYKGTVSSVCSYGAFIDLKGAQGLLHISEMTWERNANANNILKQGQEVKVKIKTLDKENKRIQLSYDKKGEDPWSTIDNNVGDIVNVKIKKLVQFGAFAELKPAVEGLIHISQISEEKVTKPEDKLRVGQKVSAKIIELDKENKKMELSIKEAEGSNNQNENASDEPKVWQF